MILAQDEGLEHEVVHLGLHKTSIAVGGSANNRLASNVEARVHDNRTAGSFSKSLDDLPVQRIRLAPDGLDSG